MTIDLRSCSASIELSLATDGLFSGPRPSAAASGAGRVLTLSFWPLRRVPLSHSSLLAANQALYYHCLTQVWGKRASGGGSQARFASPMAVHRSLRKTPKKIRSRRSTQSTAPRICSLSSSNNRIFSRILGAKRRRDKRSSNFFYTHSFAWPARGRSRRDRGSKSPLKTGLSRTRTHHQGQEEGSTGVGLQAASPSSLG